MERTVVDSIRGLTLTVEEVAVQPVKVVCRCPATACPGYLEFTGDSYRTVNSSMNTHRCLQCRCAVVLEDRMFPFIDYKPLKIEQPEDG